MENDDADENKLRRKKNKVVGERIIVQLDSKELKYEKKKKTTILSMNKIE